MVAHTPLALVTTLAGLLAASSTPPTRCRTVCDTGWDGERYVVHEWGTFTAVQGSDGGDLPGLLHDPFDLPEFVYDLTDELALTALTVKMETPVVYFYAPRVRTSRACASLAPASTARTRSSADARRSVSRSAETTSLFLVMMPVQV